MPIIGSGRLLVAYAMSFDSMKYLISCNMYYSRLHSRMQKLDVIKKQPYMVVHKYPKMAQGPDPGCDVALPNRHSIHTFAYMQLVNSCHGNAEDTIHGRGPVAAWIVTSMKYVDYV